MPEYITLNSASHRGKIVVSKDSILTVLPHSDRYDGDIKSLITLKGVNFGIYLLDSVDDLALLLDSKGVEKVETSGTAVFNAEQA